MNFASRLRVHSGGCSASGGAYQHRMDWHLIGLGVSALSSFGRYRVPIIPKPLASAAMAEGLGIVMLGIFRSIQIGPALTGMLGIGLIVAAIEWQIRDHKPSNFHGEGSPKSGNGVASEYRSNVSSHSAIVEPLQGDGKVRKKNPMARQSEGQKDPPVDKSQIASQRAAVLRQLTHLYILSNGGISSRMMAGLELPPEEFLNKELERQGLPWRVRNVSGANADTYDVSST